MASRWEPLRWLTGRDDASREVRAPPSNKLIAKSKGRRRMRVLVYTVTALWLAFVVVAVADTDAAARVIALIDHK